MGGPVRVIGHERQACHERPQALDVEGVSVFLGLLNSLVKHRDSVSRVTFWGFSDADSWLNRGRMNYPLLWDRQRQPKPAFQAVVDVLTRGR